MDGVKMEAVKAGWVFSLARCGSSIAAYAAAAPWNLAVADEIFGPWDRTVAPYNYPQDQKKLIEIYWNQGERYTPEVIATTNRLLSVIKGKAGRVVCKHPHTAGDPDEFASAFPNHRVTYLIRNPLHRLNSLYQRGWLDAVKVQYDLGTYKFFLRRWKACKHRFVYDQLATDPAAFFAGLYDAWDWDYTPEDVQIAVAYCQNHYHGNSRVIDKLAQPDKVRSQQAFTLPAEAVMAYLDDPEVRELMVELGWSLDPTTYGHAELVEEK